MGAEAGLDQQPEWPSDPFSGVRRGNEKPVNFSRAIMWEENWDWLEGAEESLRDCKDLPPKVLSQARLNPFPTWSAEPSQ